MEQQDIAHGLRLAAIAVISALVTATVVIGAGEVWLSRSVVASASSMAPSDAGLIRTSG